LGIAHEVCGRVANFAGDFEELLGRETSDDYMIIGLTDKGAVLDAFARLHKRFPRLLHVSKVLSTGQADSTLHSLAGRDRENLSDLDLFAAFFAEVSGAALDENERVALIETLREIERSGEGGVA
jgi:hypothetical protein